MNRVTIAVDTRAWHALKVTAATLDCTLLELINRLGQGNARAIAEYQRRYRECEEK